MASHMRLKAAVSTAVLASTLATPFVAEASASTTTPAIPDVTAALTNAGLGSSTIASVTSELGTLQGLAPGVGLGLGGLNGLDSALSTLNGGLLSSILGLVTSLELVANPASAPNLTSLLGGLNQVGSAPAASTAVQQAVAELTAALTTSGLGQLLTQVPGLSAGGITSALSSLAGVQGLPLGGSVPAGSLAPVGSVLTAIAGQTSVPAGAASALTSAAGVLNGNAAISPTSLLSVLSELQSAGGSLPSPLQGVVSDLAAQLAGSGSIFGGLSGVGNAASLSTITGALGGIGALPALIPGGSVSAGSLAPLANLLTAIASEPGVPSSATTALTNAASTLSGAGALDPTALLTALSNLQGISGLPSPLDSLVAQITSALGGSGSIFGAIPGLNTSTIAGALGALQGLTSLGSGATIPSGTLSPVASILTTIAGQPGVPSAAASILTTAASQLTTNSLSPAALLSLVSGLRQASGLPLGLGTVVAQLADMLAGSGTIFGGLPGLNAGTLSSALSTLEGLPGLSSGAVIPAGLLSPVATILTTVGAQPGVPAQAKAWLDEIGSLFTSSNISASTLALIVKLLNAVATVLPAPLSSIVGDLTGQLSSSGTLRGSLDTGSPGSGGGGSKPGGSPSGASAQHGGHLTVLSIRRSGNTLIANVRCTATSARSCRSTVSAWEGSRRLASRKVTVRGGRTSKVRLSLARIAGKSSARRHRVAVKVTAKTGSFRSSKVAHLLLGR